MWTEGPIHSQSHDPIRCYRNWVERTNEIAYRISSRLVVRLSLLVDWGLQRTIRLCLEEFSCARVCPSVCLCVCPSGYVSVLLAVCLSVQAICPSVYVSVRLAIYLSFCLSVCLSFCLSVSAELSIWPVCLPAYFAVLCRNRWFSSLSFVLPVSLFRLCFYLLIFTSFFLSFIFFFFFFWGGGDPVSLYYLTTYQQKWLELNKRSMHDVRMKQLKKIPILAH